MDWDKPVFLPGGGFLSALHYHFTLAILGPLAAASLSVVLLLPAGARVWRV